MENFNGNGTINHNNTRVMLGELVWYMLPSAVAAPPLALPANALVIRLLLGKPGICSTSEIFVLNLAVFDLLNCCMFLAEYTRFLCLQTAEAAAFIAFSLSQTGGPMFFRFLSLDSYLAVCHPLLFLRLKDPKLRLSVCLMGNAVTAACCYLMKVSKQLKWKVMSLILCDAIVIISACNILILRSLRQTGPSRKQVHLVKKRAFNVVLTSFVLVIIHCLLSLIEFVLRYFWPRRFSPYSAPTCVAYTFLSMGGFVQPLCYLARTKQLPKLRCHRGSAAETTAVATV